MYLDFVLNMPIRAIMCFNYALTISNNEGLVMCLISKECKYLLDDVHYDAYVDVMTLKKQDGGMNAVNLSVVCKLIVAFPPENICVSVK